jgi:hypothetical protein
MLSDVFRSKLAAETLNDIGEQKPALTVKSDIRPVAGVQLYFKSAATDSDMISSQVEAVEAPSALRNPPVWVRADGEA